MDNLAHMWLKCRRVAGLEFTQSDFDDIDQLLNFEIPNFSQFED